MASSVQGGKPVERLFLRLKGLGHHLSKNPRFGIPALVLVLALLYAVVGITHNPLRIVKMEPEGEVGVKSNLTFYFSREVVAKEEVGQLMVSEKITFDPPVPGKIRWEDQKTLKFFPEAPLLPSTRYTVKIAKDISTLKGVSLAGNRTLEFTTELFRIKQANLALVYEAQTRKGLVLQGRLVFNHPVGLEELRRHLMLRFTDDRTAIGYTVRLENGGREVVLTSELLQYGKSARRIELVLPEGFLCLGGKIGLKNRFVRVVDLRERRALKVNAIETSTGGGVCNIVIHFSEPPDPAVLENFIAVRPEMDFTVTVDGEKALLSAGRFETGGTYEVTVKKGLPALNGDPLPRDFTGEVTFPDLEPSIGFNSPGRYLSSRGHLNLGLETVNVDRVEVEIAKIYANNLVSFLHRIEEDGRCYSYELARLGRVVDSRIITIEGERNKVVTTPLNLGQFLNDQRKGLFQVTARDPEARWLDAVKIAIITDLGILAKFGADDLVVWVNSLDTLAPYPGVRVSLVSYNNQEIVSGYTDESGVVTFAGIRKRLAESRPYLILAECGEDFSFVHLDEGLIDKTDFEVDGRPRLRDGYEAYLYTDRGVFRPGDTANLAAVVRGADATVPPEFPLRLEKSAPTAWSSGSMPAVPARRGSAPSGWRSPITPRPAATPPCCMRPRRSSAGAPSTWRSSSPTGSRWRPPRTRMNTTPGRRPASGCAGLTSSVPPPPAGGWNWPSGWSRCLSARRLTFRLLSATLLLRSARSRRTWAKASSTWRVRPNSTSPSPTTSARPGPSGPSSRPPSPRRAAGR